MEIEHWSELPESVNAVDPEPHTLEYELGTPVSIDTGPNQYGGVLVGVNEYGRPIVMYVGPTPDGRAITTNFRTSGWDTLTEL